MLKPAIAATSEYVRTVSVSSNSSYTVPPGVYSLIVSFTSGRADGVLYINGTASIYMNGVGNGLVNNIRCVSGDVVSVSTSAMYAVLQEYTL